MRNITGDLVLRTIADVADAADIGCVGGWLDIRAEGTSLPALTSISGGLYIHAEGASLPALTSVDGGLNISAEDTSLPALTSVDGGLNIRAEGASLPALTSIGGGLDIRAEDTSLPGLGAVLAHSTWSLVKLHASGLYAAGCRGPWSRDQALAHWGGRSDERAVLFSAALRADTR